MAKPQTSNNSLTNDLGRVPPHNLELEEAVIGALMLEQEAINDVIEILKAESFYSPAHGKIFDVILFLFNNSQPINIISVCEELSKKGELETVGGRVFVAELTSRVASTANIEYNAKIVAQKYIQRELIRVTSEIQRRSFDDGADVVDLIDFSENELFKISEGNIKKNVTSIGQVVMESLRQIEANSKKADGLSGVPSGFTLMDKLTNGWQPSDLVIVAARPSMGKTAFVLSMARNMVIEHQRPVAFFSLEMASVQLVNRLIASECEIPADKLRSGKLEDWEWQKLEQRIQSLKSAKLFIDDTAAISVSELRAKCRRLAHEHKIELVIIDYMQLMTGSNSASREQEVAMISRSLKALAKELNIPILALSQLNRSVETRTGNKRPQLSDLRESGSIEQDADLVLFIHRPEYYKIPEMTDGSSSEGKAEIIIAKHRNGAVGDIDLQFVSEYARFSDLGSVGLPDPQSFENEAPFVVNSKMNIDSDIDYDLVAGIANDTISSDMFDEDIPF